MIYYRIVYFLKSKYFTMTSEYIQEHQPNKFDIIRSFSKDKYYKSKQVTLINSLLANFPRINADQCRLISDCLYYSLTTLLNRQTLGEESYYLVEFGRNKNIPALFNRVVMVALKIYVPYIVKSVPNLNLLNLVLLFLENLNDLVFIWSKKSTYINLENRFSGIGYLSLLGNSSNENVSDLRIIAALKTINFAVFCASLIKKWKRKQPKTIKRADNEISKSSVETEQIDTTNKCSICLEMLKNPTLTSCGHIFCWKCIQGYAVNVNNTTAKFNCPSCRLLIKSERLVFLHNF